MAKLFHSRFFRIARLMVLIGIVAAIIDLPLDAPVSFIVSDAQAQARPEMPDWLVPLFVMGAAGIMFQIRRRNLAKAS